jgi:hypothetical protein
MMMVPTVLVMTAVSGAEDREQDGHDKEAVPQAKDDCE